MKISDLQESVSPWMDTAEMPEFTRLENAREVDVCVIGAGVGGITAAYLLLKEGKSVCVLESTELGSGQTGRTTAHFTTALDDRYYNVEEYHGEYGARLAAESHQAAIDWVEETIKSENIDCEMERVNGYLFNAEEEFSGILTRELAAVHRAGLSEVRFAKRAPFSSYEAAPALCYPDQIQLHPLRYLRGLAIRVLKMGGEIYTRTRVVEVQGGDAARVKVENGAIVRCKSIIVATNSPIDDWVDLHAKQATYRTYVIGMEIPRGTLQKALFWDTQEPYHYVRVEDGLPGNADVLIVGGEDHKMDQNEEPQAAYARLEEWTQKRFPNYGRVVYRWSGQIMEPMDGLAFLGRNLSDSNNIYVISGDSGNGMTHCTIGGLLIADQIMGRENEWEKLYNPGRTTLRALGAHIRENTTPLEQFADWLRDDEFLGLEMIPPGEGAVFRNGLKKIAAYKDENGVLEFISASCTHLGGVVRWNNAEKSWDCPCHGSRFDSHGHVIVGPAITDLKPLTAAEAKRVEMNQVLEEENNESKGYLPTEKMGRGYGRSDFEHSENR